MYQGLQKAEHHNSNTNFGLLCILFKCMLKSAASTWVGKHLIGDCLHTTIAVGNIAKIICFMSGDVKAANK